MSNKENNQERNKVSLPKDLSTVKKSIIEESKGLDDIDAIFDESDWDYYMQQEPKPLSNKVSSDLYHTIQKQTTKAYLPEKSSKVFTLKSMYSVAAALLVFFSVALGIYLYQNVQEPNVLANEEMPTLKEVKSENKAITLELPDGSMVTLAPYSKINYLANFTATERDIYLEGTAKFQVSKDPNRPFSVDCKGLVTEALGTVFTVREKIEQTEVLLHEGKVKVFTKADNDNVSYLKAGDKITYFPKTGAWNYSAAVEEREANQGNKVEVKEEKSSMNSDSYVVENGQLVFKNIELKKVLSALESIYNCKISFPRDMDINNMYLSVDTSQSVQTVLNNILLLNDLQLHVIGTKEFRIEHKK